MVINPWLDCPISIHSTDFSILEKVGLAHTDDTSDNERFSREDTNDLIHMLIGMVVIGRVSSRLLLRLPYELPFSQLRIMK